MEYSFGGALHWSAGRGVFVFSSSWPWAFGILAVMLLLSGIDDLIPVAICLTHRLLRKNSRASDSTDADKNEQVAQRRIAIFVPCWKESAVIGNMVRHNLAAIRYRNYDFFLGVYPNDEPTVQAAEQLAETFRNVHVAIGPNPGPTSKADCLNGIYRRMTRLEEEEGVYFDSVVLHDAEDLIHAEALALINRERARYDMVQVPVLPLATPVHEPTHGVYCDEFAEYQMIDMLARQYSGSFVPSNGVGTGFAREILEELANERGEVFDAESLTEDYEIGVHIHAAGYRQLFAPLKREEDGFVATREYFPRAVRTAIRQRTRWVTGIALQCWERRGWRGNWRTRYWFWRDRKGLFANPISLLTNVLFVAGLLDWCLSLAQHRPWAFAVNNPQIMKLCWLTVALQCFRLALRMVCAARVFGLGFALGVPLRSFHGNLINCCASMGALWRYAHARRDGHKLVWLKTEHAYPTRDALVEHRGDLADVLVGCGFLSPEQLADVRREMPSCEDLREYVLAKGLLTDENLCLALSLYSGLPSTKIAPEQVKPRVARSLPKHVERRFGLVPFAVSAGRLLVAGAAAPSAEALNELKRFTPLPIEVQLVTRQNYEELRKLL